MINDVLNHDHRHGRRFIVPLFCDIGLEGTAPRVATHVSEPDSEPINWGEFLPIPRESIFHRSLAIIYRYLNGSDR